LTGVRDLVPSNSGALPVYYDGMECRILLALQKRDIMLKGLIGGLEKGVEIQ